MQRGSFKVRRGIAWPARVIASLLRFPAEGEVVPLALRITSRGRRETWRRVFDKTPMVTTQYDIEGRILVERLGPLALHFRLEVDAGALVFRLVDARFLGLSLPRFLRPRVSGREWGPDRPRVAIRAEAPVFGLLLAYEGVLE